MFLHFWPKRDSNVSSAGWGAKHCSKCFYWTLFKQTIEWPLCCVTCCHELASKKYAYLCCSRVKVADTMPSSLRETFGHLFFSFLFLAKPSLAFKLQDSKIPSSAQSKSGFCEISTCPDAFKKRVRFSSCKFPRLNDSKISRWAKKKRSGFPIAGFQDSKISRCAQKRFGFQFARSQDSKMRTQNYCLSNPRFQQFRMRAKHAWPPNWNFPNSKTRAKKQMDTSRKIPRFQYARTNVCLPNCNSLSQTGFRSHDSKSLGFQDARKQIRFTNRKIPRLGSYGSKIRAGSVWLPHCKIPSCQHTPKKIWFSNCAIPRF